MAKKWYVIHTYSGYENKVRTNLLHRIESMGMQDRIFDVKIPTETVTDIKEGGRRVTSEKKVFPGYILVQMELGDESWYVVRNTPGVTGFVGSQGKVTSGPFAEFDGTIAEVNLDKSTVKVMVTIFGRETPVELEFGQVAKV